MYWARVELQPAPTLSPEPTVHTSLQASLPGVISHTTHWQLKTDRGGNIYTTEVGKRHQHAVDPQTKFSLGLLMLSTCLLRVVPSCSFTPATSHFLSIVEFEPRAEEMACWLRTTVFAESQGLVQSVYVAACNSLCPKSKGSAALFWHPLVLHTVHTRTRRQHIQNVESIK